MCVPSYTDPGLLCLADSVLQLAPAAPSPGLLLGAWGSRLLSSLITGAGASSPSTPGALTRLATLALLKQGSPQSLASSLRPV